MRPVAATAAAAATLFSSCVWSATENPASRSQANPLLDGSVVMETALGLGLIILLIFGLGWMLRRFGRLPTGSRGEISVISGTSLGPRERAVLLQVGHTRLLVGVAPGRVQTLHVFDAGQGSASGEVDEPDFDHELQAEIDGGPR
jgi:flagellar protein FliO/FliZ